MKKCIAIRTAIRKHTIFGQKNFWEKICWGSGRAKLYEIQ